MQHNPAGLKFGPFWRRKPRTLNFGPSTTLAETYAGSTIYGKVIGPILSKQLKTKIKTTNVRLRIQHVGVPDRT